MVFADQGSVVTLKRFAENRWLALVALACAAISGVLWSMIPSLTWQPLLVGLLPGAVRLLAGRFPFRRSPFDAPLAIYLLTAGIGIWAAYDPGQAWSKFWLIVGALMLFYALASQPPKSIWLVTAVLGGCGLALTSVFLLAFDWQKNPTRFALVNEIGAWWMSVRPAVGGADLNPDVVGGVVALLLPFAAAFGIRLWTERHIVPTVFIAALNGLILFGLFLTAQRGAWLALGIVLCLRLLWAISGAIASRTGRSRRGMLAVIILLLLGLALESLFVNPTAVLGLSVPGNRLEVAHSTLYLIADFAFTGGGLAAYPGLYSRYILQIPWLFVPHSSNLFLDTAVDQGLPGLIALLTVVGGSIWLLATAKQPNGRPTSDHSLLRWAVLSSTIVLVVYGLFEDPFYAGWGALFLFIPSGMAAALSQPGTASAAGAGQSSADLRNIALLQWARAGVALLVLTTALAVGVVPALRSAWWANLGAVYMARVELAGWPAEAPYRGSLDVSKLDTAASFLLQSVESDSGNVAANYRLSILAAYKEDHDAVTAYLENAYRTDSQHRGVRKMLGYSYVWDGRFDEAAILLADIPEARYELEIYSRWWGAQGRDDLSGRAARMASLLGSP